MSDHAGFLRAIREEPDDDTPRLIYADWLEENGDPDRAEFIRTQIELEELPEENPLHRSQQSRVRQLLTRHRSAWLGPLEGQLEDWQFRRGFLASIKVRPRTLLTLCCELDERTPGCHVKLHGGFGDRAVQDLAECPNLGWLTGLQIESFHVRYDGIEALAHSPHLSRLTELNLRWCPLETRGVLALALSTHRRGLTH